MPDRSLVIASFKYGLDTRRESLASLPGTLQVCNNAFVNSGGELEKRRAFVLLGPTPSGVGGFFNFGFQDTDSGIQIFSTDPDPSGGFTLPTNVVWKQITYQTAWAAGLTNVIFSCCFKGKSFILAQFDAVAPIFAYYDGVLVPQITDGLVLKQLSGAAEGLSDLSKDLAAIVNRLPGWVAHANVTAGLPSVVPAVGYNESALTGGTLIMTPIGVHMTPVIENNNSVAGLLGTRLLDQNYSGIGAVAAAIAFTLNAGTNGTVNVQAFSHANGTGVISLTNGTVAFNTTLTQTAADIVTAINNFTYVTGYSAVHVLATVTVYAPVAFGNVTFNGTVTCTGDITSIAGAIGRVMSLTLGPNTNIDAEVDVQGNGYFDIYSYMSAQITGNSAPVTFTWTKLNGVTNNNSPTDNIIFSTNGWTTTGPVNGPITGVSCAFHARIPAGTTIEANFLCVASNGVDPDVSQWFFCRLSVNH